MGKDELLAFVRHALTVAGTALASYGVLSADQATALANDAMVAIGAIMPIAAFIWSLVQKRQQRQAVKAAAATGTPVSAAGSKLGASVPGSASLAVLLSVLIVSALSACSATSGSLQSCSGAAAGSAQCSTDQTVQSM